MLIHPLTSGESCLIQTIIVAGSISSFISFKTLGSKWQLPASVVCQVIQFPSGQCLCSPVWNFSTENLKNVSSIFPANGDSSLVKHRRVSGYLAGTEPSHISCLEDQPVELQYGWTEFILRNHSSWSWQVNNAKLGTELVLIYDLMHSWCLMKYWYHCGFN